MTPREEEGDPTRPGDTLAGRLRARIRREGPMTFRDWMEAALYDPRAGYYRREGVARWGRAGDYRTSPERTPLFAATFARHFAALYDALGAPGELTVVEAGAGAGDFASGMLSTLRRDHPRVFASLRYLIDEKGMGEEMSAGLAAKLAPFAGRVGACGLARADAPFGACIVFSNELLDALPVHRVRARGGALAELFVGTDEGGGFVWGEGEPSTPRLAEHFRRAGLTLAEGQTAEVNLDAEEWVASAARAVGRGYVVTVDYGEEAGRLYDPRLRPDGSLRAYRRHAFAADVLADPGEQDITTTVNWTQIISAGERAGLRAVSLDPLDRFLARAGVLEQLERESAEARDEAERASLRLGAREMILPGGMAGSFQVLVQSKA